MQETARFFVPFAKVKKLEDGRLLVEGTATSDTVDDAGDVITYDASRKAFAAWPGNVREMHQPKAVGRAAEWLADDSRRAIILRSFISKGAPDTQEKILDGTLKGYSILAKATKRPTVKMIDGVKARVIDEYELLEVSVVDRGMNPDTNDLAVLAKADGFTTLVEGGATMPTEVLSETTTAAAAAEAPASDTPPEVISKAAAEPQASDAPAPDEPKPVAKHYSYSEPESDIECAIMCLRMLKGLKAAELAEDEQEPEQIGYLEAAIESIKRFIGEEAMELVEIEMAAPAPTELARSFRVVRAALARVAATQPEALSKAIGAAIPAAQTYDDTVLRKAVTDQAEVTAKAIGEVRDGLKAVSEGVTKLLAQPVPGGPVRLGAYPKGHAIVPPPGGDEAPGSEVAWLEQLLAKSSDPSVVGFMRVQLAHAKARAGLTP